MPHRPVSPVPTVPRSRFLVPVRLSVPSAVCCLQEAGAYRRLAARCFKDSPYRVACITHSNSQRRLAAAYGHSLASKLP